MFHAQDGLFFERLENGGVAVLKRGPWDGPIEFRIELTAEAWASIVASMSAAGETYDTWKAALDRQKDK